MHLQRIYKHGHINIKSRELHNCSNTPEYHVWENIKARCLNPKTPNYYRYGGRGITLCESWMKFTNFLKDMGQRPSPLHEIDRINNNGNYCADNCRWVTATENIRNSSTVKINVEDATHIKDLLKTKKYQHKTIAEMTGISIRIIRSISRGAAWKDIN